MQIKEFPDTYLLMVTETLFLLCMYLFFVFFIYVFFIYVFFICFLYLMPFILCLFDIASPFPCLRNVMADQVRKSLIISA